MIPIQVRGFRANSRLATGSRSPTPAWINMAAPRQGAMAAMPGNGVQLLYAARLKAIRPRPAKPTISARRREGLHRKPASATSEPSKSSQIRVWGR